MFLHLFTINLVQQGAFHYPGIKLSESFITCSDKQLSHDFTNRTGISLNNKICLRFAPIDFFMYIGQTSVMKCTIIIGVYGNDTTLNWKSHSGKTYSPWDDFDCEDVSFWFGDLDTGELLKQLTPTVKTDIKLKNLTYQLEVKELNMDMNIELTLKEQNQEQANNILNGIYNMINDYNNASMKNDRDVGVVHNARLRVEGSIIKGYIDTGSVGMFFLKKLLRFLSKLEAFEKVVIG